MMRKAMLLIILVVLFSSCSNSENGNSLYNQGRSEEKNNIQKDVSPTKTTDLINQETEIPSEALSESGAAEESQELISARYLKYPDEVVILAEEDIASIPNDAIQIMSTYSGAAGGAGDPPCVFGEPTDGYSKPVVYPSVSSVDRLYGIGVTTCGWPVDEEVTVQISLPSGEVVEETKTPWDKGVNAYYELQFTDELGEYKFTFEGNSGKLERIIELRLPDKPTAYLLNYGWGPLILVGFSSNEEISISFYQLAGYGVDNADHIIGFTSLQVNDQGQLLIDFVFDQTKFVYLIEGEKSGTVNPHEAEVGRGFGDGPWDNRVSQNCTFNSEFIKDVTIPDGTVIQRNETFTKTWRLKNNGTCDWNSNDEIYLHFYDGHSLGEFKVVKLPADIFPVRAGETVDISLELTAPDYAGKFRSQWQLFSIRDYGFGKKPYVDIVVP